MTHTDIKARLEAVLQQYPSLHYRGFGPPLPLGSWRKLPQKDRDRIFAEDRQQLLNATNEVALAVEWLSDVEQQKKINPKARSYGLKHTAETLLGTYLGNGVFMAAAIIAGFKLRVDRSGLNACFNMSQKSINRKSRDIIERYRNIQFPAESPKGGAL